MKDVNGIAVASTVHSQRELTLAESSNLASAQILAEQNRSLQDKLLWALGYIDGEGPGIQDKGDRDSYHTARFLLERLGAKK